MKRHDFINTSVKCKPFKMDHGYTYIVSRWIVNCQEGQPGAKVYYGSIEVGHISERFENHAIIALKHDKNRKGFLRDIKNGDITDMDLELYRRDPVVRYPNLRIPLGGRLT